MSLPLIPPLTTPVTTAHQPHTLTTTTTVHPTSSNQTPSPALHTRPAGWHAQSFGYDWNKRTDHHKYLVKNGLTEVHAAIVNDDWDLALELICPEDLGLHWLPTASQRPPKNSSKDLDASSWPVKLMSQNEDIRKLAILNMAIQTCDATSIDTNSLYGANLLNLCLIKPARPDVLQHVITLAKTQAPHYLNLPDAVGRTPLWVAIENQDQASVQLLLKAGANPLQACKFSALAEPKSLLSLAAKSAYKEIFRDLLHAVVEQGKKFAPYNFNHDPLCLKCWASDHSPEDVQWLADQIETLRGPLLCCDDASGSSYFYRSVIDGSLDAKLASRNEDVIEWLRMLDASPLVPDDDKLSPLYAAATQASIAIYQGLVDFYFSDDKALLIDTDKKVNLYGAIQKKFFLRHTVTDFEHFLDGLPDASQAFKSSQKKYFIDMQLQALLYKQHKLNFDNYARTVKSVWPFISDTEKSQLFVDAALRADDRMELVFGLLDFSIKSSTLEKLMYKASVLGKTAAFEFAADRSLEMGAALESLSNGNDTGHGMFLMALTAGSLKWAEKLIAAGINRQKAIADSSTCIFLLADLDPAGLQEKLKGLNYTITELMISHARTEPGKQALMELMTNASNNS
jgi:ankyrin repeat protein